MQEFQTHEQPRLFEVVNRVSGQQKQPRSVAGFRTRMRLGSQNALSSANTIGNVLGLGRITHFISV